MSGTFLNIAESSTYSYSLTINTESFVVGDMIYMINGGEGYYSPYERKGIIVAFNLTSKTIFKAEVIDPGAGFFLSMESLVVLYKDTMFVFCLFIDN